MTTYLSCEDDFLRREHDYWFQSGVEAQFYEVFLRLRTLEKQREARSEQTSEVIKLISGNAWYFDTVDEMDSLQLRARELLKKIDKTRALEIINRAKNAS